MSRTLTLVGMAWRTLRQHPLRTLLSTLGLVIGVAALVAVLALADGLEQYARDQISTTTDLQSIYVQASTTETVDGVALRRDEAARLGEDEAAALLAHLGAGVTGGLVQRRSVAVERDTLRTAAVLTAGQPALWALAEMEAAAGRALTPGDTTGVMVSPDLAERLGGAEAALGQRSTAGWQELSRHYAALAEDRVHADALPPARAAFALRYFEALRAGEVEDDVD